MTQVHTLIAFGLLCAGASDAGAAEPTRTRPARQEISSASCPETVPVPPASVSKEHLLKTVTALEETATGCEAKGRYADAIVLLSGSVHLRETTQGDTHAGLATPLLHLGRIHRDVGRLADAEQALSRALRVFDAGAGPAVVPINIRMELGELYRLEGKEAAPLYGRALADAEAAFGSGDARVASVLNNWALFEKSRGRYAEAEQLYGRALAIRRQVSGPNHPDTATVLSNLGQLARQRGDRAQARQHIQTAVRIWEASFGPEDPVMANGLSNLASLLTEEKKYERAEGLYRRVLAITETHYGVESLRTGQELNNLGALLYRADRFADARGVFERALKLHRRASPSSLETARVARNLAETYIRLQDAANAETLYREALTIWEAQGLTLDTETLPLLDRLRMLLRTSERFAEAEKLAARAMRIRVKQALLAERLASQARTSQD